MVSWPHFLEPGGEAGKMTRATKWTKTRWLWVFVVILLVAYAARILMFQHALPFIAEHDEPNFYMIANDWRGRLDAAWRNEWLDGYPPGYLWFYMGALDVIDGIFHPNIHIDMSVYIRLMRLLAIWIDMITLSLVILLAKRLADVRAGMLAGAVWAISNAVLDNAIRALPDGPTVLLCVLCAIFCIFAFKRENWRWAILATATGLLAIVFKYAVFPILLLPAGYFLFLLWRNRIRALIPAAVALTMVAGTAYGLLVVYGASGLENAEAQQLRERSWINFTDTTRWRYMFNGTFGTIGPILAIMGLIVVVVFVIRRQRLRNGWAIALIFLTSASILAVVPAYLAGSPPRIYPTRYTWPGLVLLIPVTAAVVVQGLAIRQRPKWVWAVVLLVPIIALIPDMPTGSPGTLTEIAEFRKTHAFTLAQAWVDETLPDGSVLWMDGPQAFLSLSHYDRGFYSYKQFDGLYAPDAVQWKFDLSGINYVYLDGQGVKAWPRIPSFPPLERLTLLKRMGGPSTYENWEVFVYSPIIISEPQNIVFQSATFQLLLWGYVVNQDENQFTVDTFWQAPDGPPPVDYSYNLYLTPLDKPANVLQQNNAQLGLRRTSTWDDPNERVEGGIPPFMLLDTVEPGDYALNLVVYDSSTGERLSLVDGQTTLLVTEVHIQTE
jgi:hypothetical protein